MKVFISYSAKDAKIVRPIHRFFVSTGIRHFTFVQHIAPGHSILQKIRRAISNCTHLLAVVSKASLKSQWVAYEIGQAHAKDRIVVPYRPDSSLSLPDFLHHIRCLNSLDELKKFFASVHKNTSSRRAISKPLRGKTQSLARRLSHSSLHKYDVVAVEKVATLASHPDIQEGWAIPEIRLDHRSQEFALPPQYKPVYESYFKKFYAEQKFMDDKPKIMVRKNPLITTDTPTLVLPTQETKYSQVQFYRHLVEKPGKFRGISHHLKLGERLRLSLLEDIFCGRPELTFAHSLCMETVVETSDEQLLLIRRPPNVAYCPSKWSCSIAETFAKEDLKAKGTTSRALIAGLERALNEELGLTPNLYKARNCRVLSVFLETDVMNVSLCVHVTLDIDRQDLDEHIVGARQDKEFTQHAYASWEELLGEVFAPQRKYDTTSRYKMLFSCMHRFGERDLWRKAQKMA